jgi:trehalose monomycolate/heme transporter
MVEARARGMPTTDAVRIGTATTGRLITAAALVLAVVAGTFVFSDLVMMKYLAFGLITALVLDATVVRMFLVPSIMKLLGDDCWWAPRWMKRLHSRIGLDEMGLGDDHKRSAPPAQEEALVGAGAPVPEWPRHDPTHPTVEGSSESGTSAGAARAARLANTPSAASTAPMPSLRTAGAGEASTTEISMAEDTVSDVAGPAAPVSDVAGQAAPVSDVAGQAAPVTNDGDNAAGPAHPVDGATSSSAPQEDRKIESWLDQLSPPHTSARWPASPTNGGDRDDSTPIPTRRRQDPNAT